MFAPRSIRLLPHSANGSWDQAVKLTWDAWNRLVKVQKASDDTVIATDQYDGMWRRTVKTNSTETRHYYYNSAWRSVEEQIERSGGVLVVEQQQKPCTEILSKNRMFMKRIIILLFYLALASLEVTAGDVRAVKDAQKVLEEETLKARKKYLTTVSKSIHACTSISIFKLDKNDKRQSDIYLPFERRWVSAKALVKGPHRSVTKELLTGIGQVLQAILPRLGPSEEGTLNNDLMEPDFEVLLNFDDISIMLFVDTESKNILTCYDYYNFDWCHLGDLKEWNFLFGLLSKAKE